MSCAGSAPIQNIGAYGVEFKDICDYVEYLDLESFDIIRLSAQECLFGYRDSIFKNDLLGKVIITSIGLKLPLKWQPNFTYGPLKSEKICLPRLMQYLSMCVIFAALNCQILMSRVMPAAFSKPSD